jgi:sec-independent protein translocase protein TatB
MDFSLFGIGFPQIMLILLVALIVFGPERLPGMARQAGRYVNQLRRLTQDARGEIQNLTRELDIRDDLNSVKADLMNIKNDLTATASGITKDFQDIAKEITLRDDAGNTMATQREQYSYQVTDAQASDGTDAVKIEETITRETIIQDAVENNPATATEVLSVTTNSEDTGVIDSTTTDPGLRVIKPARPMDADIAQVVDADTGTLSATESLYMTPAESAIEPDSQETVPLTTDSTAETQTANGVSNGTTEETPGYSFYGTPAATFAEATPPAATVPTAQELEASLEKTRQELNERVDKLESQLIERMDRVEKLLASQFIRAHQEQGG